MKNKKHIDKLFKDRFKDFEVSPPPEVWGSIQNSMESRKKNRKIIPLFWKVGGVAALLALLFTISNSINHMSTPDTQVVTKDIPLEKEDDPSIKSSLIKESVKTTNNGVIKYVKAETRTEVQKDVIKIKKPSVPKNGSVQKESLTSSSDADVSGNNSDKTFPNKAENKNVAIASFNSNVLNKTKKENENATIVNEQIIKKESRIDNTSKNDAVVAASNTSVDDHDDNKKSIQDAIKEQNDLKTGIAIGQEKKYIADRWEVAPNFAPVYYNTLSEGSSIDPSFSDNGQSGAVNFSYGVQVSYAVNKRLSIRSGISNVDLSYSTGGIEIGSGPLTSALTSITYDDTQNALTVLDEGGIEVQNNANGGFGNITQKSTNGPAELIQSITYYEIPLELKYALVKSKIGVNVIGGLSTMLLGNNDVSVEAGDFSSTLGEANNLSSVSFTTNIGIGVDYKVSKKIKFNVEPMFKYQLNPYSDSSVDFQPYYIGVYTGLSYKF
jgi:hypothetical protein